MHFDARPLRVVKCPVREMLDRKIGIEFPVEHPKHVEIEFRSDAARIIVCGVQHRLGLHKVDSEQETIGRTERRAYSPEKRNCVRRIEIPDGAPEEGIEKRVPRMTSADALAH